MSKPNLVPALCAALASLAVAGAAAAHPHLLRADPAPQSISRGSPRMIHLSFSEPLIANFSGVTLSSMNGRPAPVGRAMLDPRDRQTLMAPVTQPLSPGAYVVRWRAVSVDTHRMTGQYIFRVR